jgi:branched-chain amino acid transport system permease protein
MLVGINIKRLYILAFAIGTACVGMSGSIITPFFYVSPHVGSVFLITAFVVVVLGGMGNLFGAFVGGLIVGVAESIGALFLPGSLKQVLPYLIFIVILMFKPEGLFGRKTK